MEENKNSNHNRKRKSKKKRRRGEHIARKLEEQVKSNVEAAPYIEAASVVKGYMTIAFSASNRRSARRTINVSGSGRVQYVMLLCICLSVAEYHILHTSVFPLVSHRSRPYFRMYAGLILQFSHMFCSCVFLYRCLLAAALVQRSGVRSLTFILNHTQALKAIPFYCLLALLAALS